jgi:hypothetical protein
MDFGPVLGSSYLVLLDDTGKQNSLTNLNFYFQASPFLRQQVSA